MPRGSRFHPHTHPEHQLCWAGQGILVVECQNATWVLPPSRALWVPAGVVHAPACVGPALMQSLYLAPAREDWSSPTVVVVEPLLAELIGYLERDLAPDRRERAVALVRDLLRPASTGAVHAPLPRDEGARAVAGALRAHPDDPRDLAGWAAAVNVSGRTLARRFRDETGVPFGQWRTAVRVQAALVLLAQDVPVSRVARRVGYDTTSAFVAAFRKHTGVTPGAYFSVSL
jgi:AraC-like DNA-binding protein